MADCEVLEKDCSHFIPGLFGSLLSTVLIALSLFAFDGRMALAALWVIPVSAAIVVGSYRVQDKVQAKTMAAKMVCADGIQEYIETLRDLKASNAEQRYLSGLSDKIRAVEKQSIAAELETALFVSSAGMVLKLGIASVALTGAVLLVQGSIDVLTLFLFLMAASRMYDPMQGALQNLAAVIAMRTNVGRMNEILDAPLQTGSEQLTNQGCDIASGHQNAGGLAHTLALHDPAGIGRTHQTVGACNLLERIVCGLFAQMVDQQNADIVLISQCFQGADFLVIAGIHTVVLVAGTHLLQGIDDDQPGVRVLIEETCELFFQPLPDAAAFRLHDQPFGGFFTAHKLEKALLQAVEGVLQR